MKLKKLVGLGAVAWLGASVLAVADSGADKPGQAAFEFALIGDTPYGVLPGEEYLPFDRLVEEINSNRNIQWIMHAGDIKSGSTECSDAMFLDRLERFNGFDRPLVLTPGDNDWTDCHRIAAGEYQPLERLAVLRDVFFPQPGRVTIGGETMEVNSQAYLGFPENVWWQQRGVIFSAIHVVGSHNGLAAFAEGSAAVRSQADDLEVADRIAAAVTMLDTIFAEASASDAPGVLVMIQANPMMERGITGEEDREGFVEFLQALENHTREYGKPVVLAHGDSHYFRLDQPPVLNERFLGNFTRVETYGSSYVHWVRVTVDPRSEQVFSFEQEVIEENL